MQKIHLQLFLLFSILAISWVNAGIYKWTDENGRVHFSDKKPETSRYEDIEDHIKSKGNAYSNNVKNEQDELVANFFKQIHAGNPDKTELYFVSFAGDSKQDVFMKEALFAQRLFDKKLYTKNRSIALINNSKTTSEYLVASNENLERTLKTMGRKMDDDDVLYLYLTSHGSRSHKLHIDFPPHTVKDFGGSEIRRMLDEAKIKWRVIVVSACYSGGFVEPLKTDYSVIATASDALSNSFGCADDREFTYYGEAIFKRQMSRGVGILEALDKARGIVRQMESQQGYKPSNPQLWIGYKAAEKMANLQSALR